MHVTRSNRNNCCLAPMAFCLVAFWSLISSISEIGTGTDASPDTSSSCGPDLCSRCYLVRWPSTIHHLPSFRSSSSAPRLPSSSLSYIARHPY
ncbi:hypothetical protein P152DRAFT_286916 [Eremomyces bilateralis CBS 781.70]|uniref:Secreted protein n=1 Tax=Eremomyces bilateralis CBS 781.70 TaxID=1392243 RepID=A0A6G1G6C9_9PEZI|nr:uncharacterized protein P152DRAFT_286916 [Eremomyces bilateralis CBS 781.70]KAF1813627.1 hypothetical protein P152DRAFT_286916 [Eremomyces bilateralis CBS 781.70]